MAISVHISPALMTAAQYDQVTKRLDAAGAGHPAGRRQHVCFGSGDKLQVFEVWDSEQAFDEFAPVLMPLLQEAGVVPGAHTVEPVHNRVPG